MDLERGADMSTLGTDRLLLDWHWGLQEVLLQCRTWELVPHYRIKFSSIERRLVVPAADVALELITQVLQFIPKPTS